MTPLEDFTAKRPITQDRAELATEWLVHNAHKLGAAYAEQEKAKERLKIAKARAMLASEAKTVGQQEAEALSSASYEGAVGDYFEALKEYKELDATAKAAEILIGVWRSINSAQKGAGV